MSCLDTAIKPVKQVTDFNVYNRQTSKKSLILGFPKVMHNLSNKFNDAIKKKRKCTNPIDI